MNSSLAPNKDSSLPDDVTEGCSIWSRACSTAAACGSMAPLMNVSFFLLGRVSNSSATLCRRSIPDEASV